MDTTTLESFWHHLLKLNRLAIQILGIYHPREILYSTENKLKPHIQKVILKKKPDTHEYVLLRFHSYKMQKTNLRLTELKTMVNLWKLKVEGEMQEGLSG